ncbi:MAG: Crp/Fnr family transcriptional regulator [Gammaproteobacteria bacterium]|nr:MAG: Crp/Fnr family transcriptional regulator [Gammaproteobacteria bacterium]TND02472.1 MAG: Crp/Fnr family transcriptional regulator [Gammaproteobacteria bacterium]
MSPEKIDLTQFLNQHYLCESLTVKEVQSLLDYTELVTFGRDDIIADIGAIGEALYFVVKGEAGLFYDDGTREREVGRMLEGELMGEMSFFDQEPRLLRMRSLSSDTQLLKLTRPMYRRLRIEHPFIAVNLLEHAIVSLDHLVRRVSKEGARMDNYLFGPGRR